MRLSPAGCAHDPAMTTRAPVSAGSVSVRPAQVEDSEPLAALYRANRGYLAPFEPLRDEDFFSSDGQAVRLAALLTEREQGRAYPYLVEVDGRLAGRVSVTNVVRGPFCSGSLGYWVAADQTGRGVAGHAVRRVLADCFTVHRLHRVEGATLVDNLASQAVLRRIGFTLIGAAPGYLRIAGRWRDHLLFQLLAEDGAWPDG
jgi:[ribosomal protein S5]-alanine N-acetyltransferase